MHRKQFRPTQLLTACVMSSYIILGGVAYGFSGPYIGIEVGASWLHMAHKLNTTGDGLKRTGTKLSPSYGLQAGYMYEIGASKTFIIGEIYCQTGSPHIKVKLQTPNHASAGTAKISKKFSYAPAISIGKLINPKLLPYIKLSYQLEKHQVKYTFTDPALRQFSKNVSKSSNTFVPGIGFKYLASEHLTVGLEYKYALARKRKMLSNSSLKTELTSQEHHLALQCAYRF